MIRGGISIDKDQRQLEIAQENAIMKAGKKFISLRLKDYTKNRIQGAIILQGMPYIDAITNMRAFQFVERGGPLDFTLDEFKGGMYCKMYDCEHNRKFLASVLSYDFWEIEDEGVLAAVKDMAAQIAARVIDKPAEQPKEAKLSDDDLEIELARLQSIKAGRTIAKGELNKRPLRPLKPEEKPEEVEQPGEPGTEESAAPEVQDTKSEAKGRKKRGLVTIED
jgi:hypothetical protein